MTTELKKLLLIITISAPIGLMIGLMLWKNKPSWCKSYVKFCLNMKWWLFLLGGLLFAGFSIMSFFIERPSFGVFFSVFALFELFCLFKYGCKPLTPEHVADIDASEGNSLVPRSKVK